MHGTRFHDPSADHMKDQFRFRSHSCRGIGLFAVVVNEKLGQLRNEIDQMKATLGVALADSFLMNIVSTLFDPGAYPGNVEVNSIETHIPHAYLDSFRQRRLQQPSDRFAAESRFKGVGAPFANGAFKESLAFLPSGAIGFGLGNARISFED